MLLMLDQRPSTGIDDGPLIDTVYRGAKISGTWRELVRERPRIDKSWALKIACASSPAERAAVLAEEHSLSRELQKPPEPPGKGTLAFEKSRLEHKPKSGRRSTAKPAKSESAGPPGVAHAPVAPEKRDRHEASVPSKRFSPAGGIEARKGREVYRGFMIEAASCPDLAK